MANYKEIIVNPAVIIRDDFEGFGIIYNPETDRSYNINLTGVEILKHLQNGIPLSELVEKIKENFSEVPEDISERIDRFVLALIDKGLVCYVI